MTEDIEEVVTIGVVILVLLFAAFVWFPSIRGADSTSERGDAFVDGFVLVIYTIVPTGPLALFVDFTVAAISSVVAVDRLNVPAKASLIVFGFMWALTNMIMTALNPPI